MGGIIESRSVEDVEVVDRVVSQSESGERVISTVTKLDTPISTNMCEIRYIDEEMVSGKKNPNKRLS